jgi:hypothetical protein
MTDKHEITPRIENFIGIYDGAFSKDFCEKTMQHFDLQKDNGFFVTRKEEAPKIMKDDLAVYPCATEESVKMYSKELVNTFNSVLQQCYANYSEHFFVLQEPNTAPHGNLDIKIQKTIIGGGYHIWHYESCNQFCTDRLIAWMVYLNDVEEGGETEFLYLAKRVKPKQGTLVFWPTGFTHTHRGNPPISNEKYIMTGWLGF